jgi:hypothetical protein
MCFLRPNLVILCCKRRPLAFCPNGSLVRGACLWEGGVIRSMILRHTNTVTPKCVNDSCNPPTRSFMPEQGNNQSGLSLYLSLCLRLLSLLRQICSSFRVQIVVRDQLVAKGLMFGLARRLTPPLIDGLSWLPKVPCLRRSRYGQIRSSCEENRIDR